MMSRHQAPLSYRVLIVEDDPDVRALVRFHLDRDPRFDVIAEASSAADAFRALVLEPDIVVLDHIIEGDVMGIQAAPLLKDARPTMKILLFTASADRKSAEDEEAIDAYLEKNEVRDLVAEVARLLGL
jgi:DNA-binding NarL/FixJ family response regulator